MGWEIDDETGEMDVGENGKVSTLIRNAGVEVGSEAKAVPWHRWDIALVTISDEDHS